MARGLRLVACLMNVSEAGNKDVVHGIADAASSFAANRKPSNRNDHTSPIAKTDDQTEETYSTFQCLGSVLNIFSDLEYNRSVITIAAPLQNVEELVYRSCIEAYDNIDIGKQEGGHPRLGAVDLLPFHPLSPSVSIDECGELARKLANRLANQIPGTSFFYFGSADKPNNRGLVKRRKDVQWYAGKHGIDYTKCHWDEGCQPSNRYGLTGIGAIPYMMNFNITLDTNDLFVGQEIAKMLRSTSPITGLHGIQTMAFAHEGKIEIACNVETGDLQHPELSSKYTTREHLEDQIRKLAKERHVDISSRALIGFTPEMAYDTLVEAMKQGDSAFWKKREQIFM